MSGIRVTYSGLISLGGGLITLITGIIFTLIVTRTLTPEEYGTWGLINGLIVYVLMIGPVISYWSTREIARSLESGRTAIAFTGIFSIGGSLVYIIIAFFVGQQAEASIDIMFFSAILVPVMFLNSLLIAINLGSRPHVISYGAIAYGIIGIPLALFFVYFLDMRVSGVIISATIAYVVSIVVLTFYARDRIKNKIKIEFVRKWLKLFWLPLYPGIAFIVARFDIVIFVFVAGSVFGLAFWTAALVLVSMITHSGLITRAVYPKLLEGGNRDYLKNNLTQLFYFGILFTAVVIAFARPGLFALNPIYEIAVPVVIILAIEGFFNVLSNVFILLLAGIEKVDVSEKSRFKDYVKSKLFFPHTIKLVQTIAYVIILGIGISMLVSNSHSEIDLLVYWAIVALLTQIPLATYLYVLVRRNFAVDFDWRSVLKYLLVSIGIFGMTYAIGEQFLDYKNEIFEFLPNLLLLIGLGVGGYLAITYFIDLRTRTLFKSVIHEIKNNRL